MATAVPSSFKADVNSVDDRSEKLTGRRDVGYCPCAVQFFAERSLLFVYCPEIERLLICLETCRY